MRNRHGNGKFAPGESTGTYRGVMKHDASTEAIKDRLHTVQARKPVTAHDGAQSGTRRAASQRRMIAQALADPTARRMPNSTQRRSRRVCGRTSSRSPGGNVPWHTKVQPGNPSNSRRAAKFCVRPHRTRWTISGRPAVSAKAKTGRRIGLGMRPDMRSNLRWRVNLRQSQADSEDVLSQVIAHGVAGRDDNLPADRVDWQRRKIDPMPYPPSYGMAKRGSMSGSPGGVVPADPVRQPK